MATKNQKGWVGRGPVVSVRLEPELVERLDTLAARTNRSRGAYLRMALWAALPLSACIGNRSPPTSRSPRSRMPSRRSPSGSWKTHSRKIGRVTTTTAGGDTAS